MVGEKDKDLAAPSLDLSLQILSGRNGNQGHQTLFGSSGIGGLECCLHAESSLANANGPAQVITDFGSDHKDTAVAADFLRLADQSLTLYDPYRHAFDQRHQQGVFLGFTQAMG